MHFWTWVAFWWSCVANCTAIPVKLFPYSCYRKYVYMYIQFVVCTQRQVVLLNFFRHAPKPLHSRTAARDRDNFHKVTVWSHSATYLEFPVLVQLPCLLFHHSLVDSENKEYTGPIEGLSCLHNKTYPLHPWFSTLVPITKPQTKEAANINNGL